MKKLFKKSRVVVAMLCAVVMLASCGGTVGGGGAAAEDAASFPTKDITMIIPTGSGGGSDVIARYIAAQLEADLGVAVIPENIGGGATAVAFQELQNSPADGYTIAMNLSSLATAQHNGYADFTYEDFAPICAVNFDSNSIIINTDDERFSNGEEFIQYVKDNPGELNCGTGAAGGVAHIAILDFMTKSGLDFNIVPDTAGGGFDLKLMNGDVDFIVVGPLDVPSSIAAGDIKPIISMTEERLADFPECYTAKELGVDSVTLMARGYLAPIDTPADVVNKLEESILKIVNSDEYKEFLANQYSNAFPLTTEEFTEHLGGEKEHFVGVLEAAGM